MGKKLLLICTFLLLYLSAFSQSLLRESIINVPEKKLLVQDVLTSIQDQTGLSFSYNSQLLTTTKQLNIPPGTYTVERVLHLILDPVNIVFIVKGNQIILLPKVFSSEPISIEGIVKDSSTQIPLVGAAVFFPELRQGVLTDTSGHFTILLRPGPREISISLLGYESCNKNITFYSDTSLIFSLSGKDINLAEVVIRDQEKKDPAQQISIGSERLEVANVQSMPAMFGEVDILKSLQMLPGIQSAGEGLSGLLVRGGSADQSLIMLNNATIYSPAHFLGFFSVFNPDAVEDVEVYKGGIPSFWGGRISAIINNNMKEGSYKKFGLHGGVGLISSRLSIEGPIIKDKASFLISGRRTYLDLLMKLMPSEQAKATNLFFYDLNSAFNFHINKRNKISLYTYSGDDVARFYDFAGIKWGNRIASAKWLHIFNSKLLLSSSFHYSKYQYGLEMDLEDEYEYEWSSRLKEYQLRMDFDYSLNSSSQLNFGYNATRRVFSPVLYRIKENNTTFGNISLDQKTVLEHSLYIQNEHKLNDKLSLLYGLRYTFFHNVGPAKIFNYREGEEKTIESITDTTIFSRNHVYNTYHGAEPRIMGRYKLTEESSLKFSYNRMQQFTQVASTATASLPQDRWVPSDTYIKPQIGDQYSLGYFKNLQKKKYDFSAELYYKVMRNQIDFKDGVTIVSNATDQNADVYLNNALETQLLAGKGFSYGGEFMVRKNTGTLTGWASYTYSRTRRQIAGINEGNAYSPRYDRPHDLSLVGNYKISKRWGVAATWVYTSGSAVTLPEGKYNFEGRQVPYYNPAFRNNHRLPDYHRLDLSVTFQNRKNEDKRWNSYWTLSFYNAYLRKNPLFIQYIEVINDDPNIDESEVDHVYTKDLKGVKVYFSLIPAISYNFSF